MGLILDVAVVALALVVIGSLALLAWTLAVSAVRATDRTLARVAATRRSVGEAEAQMSRSAPTASATLRDLARRTTPGDAANP